jgi:hypothetical protein
MTEKNKELELELKRLQKDVFYYSTMGTDSAAEDPEIAQLLTNNRAWVQKQLVSYCSGYPER